LEGTGLRVRSKETRRGKRDLERNEYKAGMKSPRMKSSEPSSGNELIKV
jgi:hypothetical protein